MELIIIIALSVAALLGVMAGAAIASHIFPWFDEYWSDKMDALSLNGIKSIFIRTKDWHTFATIRLLDINGMTKKEGGGMSFKISDYNRALRNIKTDYKTKEEAAKALDKREALFKESK